MIWVLRSFVSAMPRLVAVPCIPRWARLRRQSNTCRRACKGDLGGVLPREHDLGADDRPGLGRGLELDLADADEAPFGPLQAAASGGERRTRRRHLAQTAGTTVTDGVRASGREDECGDSQRDLLHRR